MTVDTYTLALNDVAEPECSDAHFTDITDGSRTYCSTSNTEGYAVVEDGKGIQYTAAVEEEDLFTLSGIISTEGIIVSDSNSVIFQGDNINTDGTPIAISSDSGEYKLALSGVEEEIYNEGSFVLDGDVASYKTGGNTAGYTVGDDGKTVTYVEEAC